MLKVLTLLSGLLVGHQNIELAVADTVARVEIRLGGAEVAMLDGPPWRAVVDFGEVPAPQRLEVVARSAAGNELARLHRGINGATDGPRAITPLRVVFEGDIPPVEAMEGWFAIGGQPLSVRGMGGGPPRLTVVSTPGARRRLGELAEASIKRQVVLRLPPGYHDFTKPWDSTVLHDRALFLAASAPLLTSGRHRPGEPDLAAAWESFRRAMPWPARTRIELVSPLGAPVSRLGSASRVFAVSAGHDSGGGGLLWQAVQSRPEHDLDLRLADAVALAGLEHGRFDEDVGAAVLLLTTGADDDRGQLEPVAVRRFLDTLDVPLFLGWWGDGEAAADGWGERSTLGTLETADPEEERDPAAELEALRLPFSTWSQELAGQRIIWLEGDHDPSEITLAPRAQEVHRAVAGRR